MKIDALAISPLNPTLGSVAVPLGQTNLTRETYRGLLRDRLQMMISQESPDVVAEAVRMLEGHPEIGSLQPTAGAIADAVVFLLSPGRIGWEFPTPVQPIKLVGEIRRYKETSLADWVASLMQALA